MRCLLDFHAALICLCFLFCQVEHNIQTRGHVKFNCGEVKMFWLKCVCRALLNIDFDAFTHTVNTLSSFFPQFSS